MKGGFFIIILITLLIVGMLVVKNMNTEDAEGIQKMETVQKAKDAVKEAEGALENMKKQIDP